jgi:hypothetical protein
VLLTLEIALVLVSLLATILTNGVLIGVGLLVDRLV